MIQEDWPEWPSPERLKEIDQAFAAEFCWGTASITSRFNVIGIPPQRKSRFRRILEFLGLKRPEPKFVRFDAISDPTPWPPIDGEPPGA